MKPKVFFAQAIFIYLLTLSCSSSSQQVNNADYNHLKTAGENLRIAITDRIGCLAKNKGLTGGVSGTKVTDVFLDFIPTGTTFDDSENILRNAGFHVHPRPNGKSVKRDYVSAWLTDSPGLAGCKVIVALRPAEPGNYRFVGSLSAGVFCDSL